MITFFSVRVSDKPADADHQYGHGKVENFSAFIETGLLLLTCVWIIYEAIKRLFFRQRGDRAQRGRFVVMLISMAWISGVRARWDGSPMKYDSQALEADALHFSTDIWSSSVVIVWDCCWCWRGRAYTWIGCAMPIRSRRCLWPGSWCT